MPGLPVLQHLPDFGQTHVHGVSDAIQPPQVTLMLLIYLPLPFDNHMAVFSVCEYVSVL